MSLGGFMTASNQTRDEPLGSESTRCTSVLPGGADLGLREFYRSS